MDPISRRAVWDAINAAKQQAAVVLTTHSMEEADALADRIGIMVRGRMRVLGGSLTLKQKYGNGYQVSRLLKQRQALVCAMHAGLGLTGNSKQLALTCWHLQYVSQPRNPWMILARAAPDL
jgi:ABC-type multidrug transport system ATPase subunit